jgi:hypothetical protein
MPFARSDFASATRAAGTPFQTSEADYDLFMSYFVPPTPNEGFNIVVHRP